MFGVTRKRQDQKLLYPRHSRSSEVRAPKKVQEIRVQWYGHVVRKKEDNVCRTTMSMKVGGMRRRGRPNIRWKGKAANDTQEKWLREQETQYRGKWRRLTKVATSNRFFSGSTTENQYPVPVGEVVFQGEDNEKLRNLIITRQKV